MTEHNKQILKKLKGGLIVSCQALTTEPLCSPYIMSRMAYAAMLGGAAGIRANYVHDIREIKRTVDLPVIGIIKAVYGSCDVYITPTLQEVSALVEAEAEIIATDATCRPRPDGVTLDEFFGQARASYPDQLFMADCSTYEEGLHAARIGFDCIGTTMSGYTEYSKGQPLPNYDMITRLADELEAPVIAEGGIWSPEELRRALECGAHAAVVGTAITRPMDITKRFYAAIGTDFVK